MKKSFWKSSLEKMKNVRMLALMAAFIAMKIAVGMIRIPVSENLRISLVFIINALESAIMGPACGMISAAITDTLSFMLFPDGAYFPGYMLSAMLGAVIYSFFLYQHKITVLRLGLSKICVNYVVNVLLGSLWSHILYGRAYIVYLSASLLKNTIALPLEIAVLAIVFHFLSPYLYKKRLLPG